MKINNQRSGLILVLIIIVSSSIILQSCLIKVFKRGVDDGSSKLTKTDSLLISTFNQDDLRKTFNYSSQSAIKFQVINARDILNVCSQTEYLWVVIGASWCPISNQALTKYTAISKHFEGTQLRFVYISQDFNLKLLQEELFEADYPYIPYLLDPKKYGTDEVTKQERFGKELNITPLVSTFKGGGVPNCFILDKNEMVCYHSHGNRITQDTIIKYCKVKPIP